MIMTFRRPRPAVPVIPCLHCGETKRTHARRLCGSCYYRHRDDYPALPMGRAVRRSSRDDCIRCERPRAIYARELCRQCWDAVRKVERFGETPKVALWVDNYDLPAPDEPTQARPGSAEKVAVMTERAAAKRCVFHPNDVSVRP